MIWLIITKITVFFIIILSCFITLLNNPIHSAFTLIFIFLITSFLFLLLNLKFLGFVIIILYAGAISILFLFIVFTINIKTFETKKNYINQTLVYLLLFKWSWTILIYMESIVPKKIPENINWLFKLNSLWNFDAGMDVVLIGRYLFHSDYYFYFIMIGLILLFAMMSIVYITKQFLKSN